MSEPIIAPVSPDNVAPPVAPVVPPLEVVGETSWQDDAGLQGNASFEKFATVNALAQSYTALERQQSGSVRIPTSEASPEAIAAFNAQMATVDGVMLTPDGYAPPPELATGYDFAPIEGFEGDESVGELKSQAHALGMTPAQAEGIYSWLASGTIAQTQASDASIAEGMAEIKGVWGNAFDQKMTGIENTIKVLNAKIPGLDQAQRTPEFVKLMDIVGDMLGEAGSIRHDPRTTVTPNEASNKLMDLHEKNSHLQEGDLGYAAYRTRSIELHKQGGRLITAQSNDY
jgi:hypothetical protein